MGVLVPLCVFYRSAFSIAFIHFPPAFVKIKRIKLRRLWEIFCQSNIAIFCPLAKSNGVYRVDAHNYCAENESLLFFLFGDFSFACALDKWSGTKEKLTKITEYCYKRAMHRPLPLHKKGTKSLNRKWCIKVTFNVNCALFHSQITIKHSITSHPRKPNTSITKFIVISNAYNLKGKGKK